MSANDEAIEAWDGVLFDRFAQFRDVILPGLGTHSDRALSRYPPPEGGRALDIGCGFGDTTRHFLVAGGQRAMRRRGSSRPHGARRRSSACGT